VEEEPELCADTLSGSAAALATITRLRSFRFMTEQGFRDSRSDYTRGRARNMQRVEQYRRKEVPRHGGSDVEQRPAES
jgi:hypothetical protein